MDNNSLSYLLQYSATGALFFVFYENSREQFVVLDSLLPPGDVRIQTKDGTVCGKCNLRQHVPVLKELLEIHMDMVLRG